MNVGTCFPNVVSGQAATAVGSRVLLAIVVWSFSATVSAGAPRVPSGFRAADGAAAEPYTGTGWPRVIVHEDSDMKMVFIPAGEFVMGSPETEAERSADEGP